MTLCSLKEILNALAIGEDDDWEFKDGKGGIGQSFMETVSAFSNTLGGTIICGVVTSDNDRTHTVRGVGDDPQEYCKRVWDALHNGEKISSCSSAKGDVWVAPVDGKNLVCARIHLAPRERRPVHLGRTPYGNTYKRRGSGDYKCSDDEVDQMKRDAIDISQDGTIIEDTSLADVDIPTLTQYRNYAARSSKPDQPVSSGGPGEFSNAGRGL